MRKVPDTMGGHQCSHRRHLGEKKGTERGGTRCEEVMAMQSDKPPFCSTKIVKEQPWIHSHLEL